MNGIKKKTYRKMKTKLGFIKIKPRKNLNDTLVGRSFILFLFFLLIFGALFMLRSAASAEENKKGYSTLPGWSAGYRYYLDLDEDKKSRLQLFGKYKQRSGNSVKFGWDKQTGRNLNDWFEDDDGVIFFEQEFKF